MPALRLCLGYDLEHCPRLIPKDSPEGRCKTHRSQLYAARDAQRPSTTQRGLGWDHRRQVEWLKAQYVAEHGALPTHCPNPDCGKPITPSNPLTGEHSYARALGNTGLPDTLRCKSCNSSAGAELLGRMRRGEVEGDA